MLKQSLLAAVAAVALTTPALAQSNWREEVPVFRVGILGGENEADRIAEYTCLEELFEERLGVETELFPAADYAGVLQGLLGGTLEYAGLGASGYAGIYIENPDAVAPILTEIQSDGSTGYYSYMYVRADSPYQTLEDLEGHSLGFADPNSTSGYLVPNFELQQQGIDPEEYFSEVGFGGGHEQTVLAVLNGQFDAGVTWTSGLGSHEEGYTAGNFRSMVDNGLLDMNDVRIVWRSSLIPNGPLVMRQDLPQELVDLVRGILVALPDEDPECFYGVTQGENLGFTPVTHEDYATIVEMRRAIIGEE